MGDLLRKIVHTNVKINGESYVYDDVSDQYLSKPAYKLKKRKENIKRVLKNERGK